MAHKVRSRRVRIMARTIGWRCLKAGGSVATLTVIVAGWRAIDLRNIGERPTLRVPVAPCASGALCRLCHLLSPVSPSVALRSDLYQCAKARGKRRSSRQIQMKDYALCIDSGDLRGPLARCRGGLGNRPLASGPAARISAVQQQGQLRCKPAPI